LESGKVPAIALNDFDKLIAAFWTVVFGKSRIRGSRHDINWLIRKVEDTELTIGLWKEVKSSKPQSIREAAWKCLFLNRTSFNGILYKAGPIGGWKQENRKLDVRFNRQRIVNRLNELFELRDQVLSVSNEGWKTTCDRYAQIEGAYLYLDPPYYHKAEQLYGHIFDHEAHLTLRNHLSSLNVPWMLSYDDAQEVRTLYNHLDGIDGRVIDQTYSAHPVGGASFIGRELFYSNRELPAHHQRLNHEHVGLSILGNTRDVLPTIGGPVRISTAVLAAIGS
jgi:DNA adenine methylase